MKKISICTVCMNRLRHLRETLPLNIRENIQYPELEFILLDYNSRDGLQTWVRENLSSYVEKGILKYYRTNEPEYYVPSHSKNMCAKLASGDIICSVDADNFAGTGYAGWIDSSLSRNGIDTVITTLRKDAIPYRDQGGKLGINATLFRSVNGYDESMRSYGMEDVDLVNRLEKAGATRRFIENEEFLRYIGHSHEERIENIRFVNEIDAIYAPVGLEDAPLSEIMVLYLLRNGTFYEVHYAFDKQLENEYIMTFRGWSIREKGCRQGCYRPSDREVLLECDGSATVCYDRQADGSLVSRKPDRKKAWRAVAKEDQLYWMLTMGYGECYNRMIYSHNDRGDRSVNPDGWGRGIVYLNFDESHPIHVT